jgi:hypothetical protein
MIQRLALFIGTALVGGLGYLAINKNDADPDADYSDDDNAGEGVRGGGGSGTGSWWDNFTSSDDADNAEKPTRRRMSGGANKSKKQRPVVARKTRVSRK